MYVCGTNRDYEESARIDGATNIQLLLRVMVPLAKPGIATITMLSAMGFWNEISTGTCSSYGRCKENPSHRYGKLV
ncbi:MAG: ABC transporter permease subunit [Ruminococcus sp.]